LLFGYWQSHLGTKRTQSKLARSWISEIAGFAPASSSGQRTRLSGTKGDPLNLSADERVEFDEDDLIAGWDLVARERAKELARGTSRKKDRLSAVGHGQVPYSDGAPAGVSFRSIQQQATVSFASLRRIRCGDPGAAAAGRALLVGLGLAGHVAAFGRSFSLRSGCELEPQASSWTWIGSDGEEPVEPLSAEASRQLVAACAGAARERGLLARGGWGKEPLVLQPNATLHKAITATWPLPRS
jgi:hypothetical protein